VGIRAAVRGQLIAEAVLAMEMRRDREDIA